MSVPSDPPMPKAPAPPPRRRSWFSKVIQISILMLASLAGSWSIDALVTERESRQLELRSEFLTGWGDSQTVHAPTLVVPYAFDESAGGRVYIKIAPTTLSTKVVLTPERKKRGLFSSTVYTAAVEMTGKFVMPSAADLESVVGSRAMVLWQESLVMVQASSATTILPTDHLRWGEETLPWRSCGDVTRKYRLCQGPLLVANPILTGAPEAGTEIAFEATVTLRGTGAFQQVLDSRQATATIESPWPTPSFSGAMLPSHQTVSEQGFKANWYTAEFAKPLLHTTHELLVPLSPQSPFLIGVDLLEEASPYRMIDRASKYKILFIVLPFTVYALFELLGVVRIHTVQYGLLGVSMTLFTLLLLSFAEQVGYDAGYWISTALVVTQTTLYTAAVTRRALPTLIFATALLGLFSFLYVLLNMQTYALLLGSLTLFLLLSVVMAVTQRVDWRAEEAS